MNKTGLIAKKSIKYVLPTSIWKYFRPISRYFAFFWEFRGISRKYLNFAGPRPREISEALHNVEMTKFHPRNCIHFLSHSGHFICLLLLELPEEILNDSFLLQWKRLTVFGVSQGRSKVNQEQKNKTSGTKNF